MTEIKITEEQFDNFIKVVEDALYNVIVKDTFEFTAMLDCFTSFASRQGMVIMDTIVDELKKLVDDDNKSKAEELGYKMWMALDSAVAGLYSSNKKYNYTANEVFEFCKGTLHWLMGIRHSPSMFESVFEVMISEDDEQSSEKEDPVSEK